MFILASLRELMAVRDVYMLWLAGNKRRESPTATVLP